MNRKEVNAVEMHKERTLKLPGLRLSCKVDAHVDPPGVKPNKAGTISFGFRFDKGPAK